MITSTKESPAAQSVEDSKVVNIKPCANGFTLRVAGQTWVYRTLDELVEKIRWELEPKAKA